MARGQRLVPASAVTRYEAQLHAALADAVAAQRAQVHKVLRMQPGAQRALTAASRGQQAAVAAVVVSATVWSTSAWRRSVAAAVQPVANQVARDALQVAKSALPTERTMGMPTSWVATANRMVDMAYSSGDSIGTRVNAAAKSATDLADADGAVDDAMDSAVDILDNVVGSMASGAANIATDDVTSYLSGYFGNLYEGASKIWNCVVADTIVHAVGATHVARRWYEGEVVDLVGGAVGHGATPPTLCTVTPNHPILTDRGWVRADSLHMGDHLVRYRFDQRAVGSGPDVEHMPALGVQSGHTAADAWAAGLRAVRGVVNLYVNGKGGQVQVVGTDGELRRSLQPTCSEPSAERFLAQSDLDLVPLLADRNRCLHCGRPRPTEQRRTAAGVHAGAVTVGLAAGAQNASTGLVAEGGTVSLQRALHGRKRHVVGHGQSAGRYARVIELQELVDVRRRPFAGHVYDLTTNSHWFLANGLVVHNSMEDDRVRPDHAEADGQEVALNDVFIVGGEAMTGPHDPSASDEQTYGCRCFQSTDGVLPDGTTSDLGDEDNPPDDVNESIETGADDDVE